MNVEGYSFDADTYCIDCTMDYARKVPYSEFVWGEHDPDNDAYLDSPGIFNLDALIEDEIIRDGDNNILHPIFDTDEAGDSPDHCSECGAYLDTSWHDSTIKYVVEALADYCMNDSGSPDTLDKWHEKLNWCGISDVDECVRELYRRIRDEQKTSDSE